MMTYEETISRQDSCLVDLHRMHNELIVLVQLIPSDETSRTIRHAQDLMDKAVQLVSEAGNVIRNAGKW